MSNFRPRPQRNQNGGHRGYATKSRTFETLRLAQPRTDTLVEAHSRKPRVRHPLVNYYESFPGRRCIRGIYMTSSLAQIRS